MARSVRDARDRFRASGGFLLRGVHCLDERGERGVVRELVGEDGHGGLEVEPVERRREWARLGQREATSMGQADVGAKWTVIAAEDGAGEHADVGDWRAVAGEHVVDLVGRLGVGREPGPPSLRSFFKQTVRDKETRCFAKVHELLPTVVAVAEAVFTTASVSALSPSDNRVEVANDVVVGEGAAVERGRELLKERVILVVIVARVRGVDLGDAELSSAADVEDELDDPVGDESDALDLPVHGGADVEADAGADRSCGGVRVAGVQDVAGGETSSLASAPPGFRKPEDVKLDRVVVDRILKVGESFWVLDGADVVGDEAKLVENWVYGSLPVQDVIPLASATTAITGTFFLAWAWARAKRARVKNARRNARVRKERSKRETRPLAARAQRKV
uniref:Uncharacterized protein n=1 Tax=Plectus sambesii TaxID=2011161 RepID=A0A914UJX9_9BILA